MNPYRNPALCPVESMLSLESTLSLQVVQVTPHAVWCGQKKNPYKAQHVESAYQVITAIMTIILKGRLFK